MRSSILASAIAAIVAAPAFAQDFNGGYLGASINWGSGSLDGTDEGEADYGLGSDVAQPDGTVGAIRGGYDWQSDQWVFGLGGELSFGEYQGDVRSKYADAAAAAGLEDLSFGVENMATVFGRVGYAVNDQFLAYGLAGWSWADGTVSSGGGSQDQGLDGFTVGLGGEFMFSDSWSAFGEYAYTNLGVIDGTDDLLEAKLNVFKLGLNYRF